MTEFLIANMAPIMFATLVVFLLSGFPVAFSLAANGLQHLLVAATRHVAVDPVGIGPVGLDHHRINAALKNQALRDLGFDGAVGHGFSSSALIAMWTPHAK